jgi:RimJ/RimL family protein N-acetyltransferase
MSHTSARDAPSVERVDFALRPISPDDKAELAFRWSQLSPETQRRRFLVAHPRLSASELRYLTEVDGHDHVAWVATPADEPGRILGVARWIRLTDRPDTAEFAAVVGDDWQGQGVGLALTERLVAEARARGVRRLTATVLADNVPIRHLLEHAGTRLDGASQGAVDEVVVQLAA